MGNYIVKAGQNIYDVALHIYGSIEGVVDLLINNTELSLCDRFMSGRELVYTDDLVINNEVVNYFKVHGVTPSNGERNIYYKESVFPTIMEILLPQNSTLTAIGISGIGTIEVDWGDNSDLQQLSLSDEVIIYNHSFNSVIGTERRIRIFGEKNLMVRHLDCSQLGRASIMVYRPIYVEDYVINDQLINLDYILLFTGTYKIDLRKIRTDSLLPLINCRHLMELDLTGAVIDQGVIDSYLIELVKRYYSRRDCSVKLTTNPSGEYKEPERDENQNYIMRTGMEAIWVLTHEPEWNEAGKWKFVINDKVYSL